MKRRTIQNLAIGLAFAGVWWLITRSPFVSVVAFFGGLWPDGTRDSSLVERIRSAWLASVSAAVIALYLKL
jgi:hypothetical protein